MLNRRKKKKKKWRTCCVPMPCLNTCHEILSQESISEDSIFTYFRSPPSCAFTVTSRITSVVIAIFETCYCRVMWSDSDTGNLSSFLAGKIGKWWREFWTFSRDFFGTFANSGLWESLDLNVFWESYQDY